MGIERLDLHDMGGGFLEMGPCDDGDYVRYSDIEYLIQERDEALEKLAAMESHPPVAWMHNERKTDVIHSEVKDLAHRVFLKQGFHSQIDRAPVDYSENYTIPLYAKPVPADKPAVAVPDERIIELAERLVAPGPKCCALSASECHEISDFILDFAAAPSHNQQSAEVAQCNSER